VTGYYAKILESGVDFIKKYKNVEKESLSFSRKISIAQRKLDQLNQKRISLKDNISQKMEISIEEKIFEILNFQERSQEIEKELSFFQKYSDEKFKNFSFVTVSLKMFYADDGAEYSRQVFAAHWEKTNGTKKYEELFKHYVYYLILNADGNIVDGHWQGYDRPDSIWRRDWRFGRIASDVRKLNLLISHPSRFNF